VTETSNTVDYRVASRDDETEILAVLEEVASEIPASFDASDRLDPTTGIIRECCQSGKSWVAVDANDKVVGFVLARKDIHEQQAISLRYIGVSKNSRGRGIFYALMEKLKANGVRLTASVLHGNQSGMVDHLVKIGFTKVGADDKETKFRWAPVVEASKSVATSRT
jgi:ribosomal protein S18 acetylase RimI-like enzyme